MGTTRVQNTSDRIDYTPGAAVLGGTPTNPGGGIIGYPDRDIAASEFDALTLMGLRKADKASATVFAVGNTVMYDSSTGLAVNPGLALDGSADLELGICSKAAGSGALFVEFIPVSVLDRYNVIRPFVYEFDCDGANGDVLEHILIPAWQNRHGLVIEACYGIVTEVMAGSSEDQGIITIEDEDDNALSPITAADAAGDAAGDILLGTNNIFAIASGAVIKTVAAGKAVQGFVSQQTSGGTPAGKIKVYVIARPLV